MYEYNKKKKGNAKVARKWKRKGHKGKGKRKGRKGKKPQRSQGKKPQGTQGNGNVKKIRREKCRTPKIYSVAKTIAFCVFDLPVGKQVRKRQRQGFIHKNLLF